MRFFERQMRRCLPGYFLGMPELVRPASVRRPVVSAGPGGDDHTVLFKSDVVSRDAMASRLPRADGERDGAQAVDPLRISVPTSGVHYAFEKLYANQADQDAWIATTL